MNFDNYLFRCSGLSHIMAGYKTYLESYLDVKQQVAIQRERCERLEVEVNGIKNTETKSYASRVRVLDNANSKFSKLVDLYEELGEKRHDIELSDGCKTHLIDLHTCMIFDRPTRDVRTKYIEKGLLLEQKAINFYSDYTGIYFEKNVERKDNGYIMGEYDFADDIVIYDAKVSWDAWTFRRNLKYLEKPRSCPYYANMQGYMSIWEKDKSKLIYVLLDTPKKLIEIEKKKLLYDFVGSKEDYEEACIELERTLTYGDIDPERKVIEIPIDRDDDFIADIPKVVTACRKYLNSLP